MVAQNASAIEESDQAPDEYPFNKGSGANVRFMDNDILRMKMPGSSLSPADSSASVPRLIHGTPLISKLSEKYRVMCETRLTSELSSRADPPHPLRVNEREYPLYLAPYDSVNRANRIFLTTLLQFGVASFPEFTTFKERDKWTIVTNFFSRLRTFESAYRADKMFPDEMEKGFQGYTLYFSEEVVDHFFDDCPNIGDKEEAKRVMKNRFKSNLGPHRESI
ncbi:hypothetical protein PENTCL1PPCAC_13399 [Pristionchus entomophagus]|uniref:NR LBD domain-containing protein n=1 Tax=Pristionchus entomophagus TaxID=358040 RepID=A0AAV5TEB0_9BILA|nr:hypothetical protein PENTCL1PPCAC_13399 [Pristionchus entomophagus]